MFNISYDAADLNTPYTFDLHRLRREVDALLMPLFPLWDLNKSKYLLFCSADLPFHFTLPREGELIGPAPSATPPHVRQLKNTPLHSTPIGGRPCCMTF